MNVYTLQQQNISICSDYDVIVFGDGTAGCCAALASSRHGVKTLLVEAMYSLGGMSTLGLVPT